jgi:hypothetical protein
MSQASQEIPIVCRAYGHQWRLIKQAGNVRFQCEREECQQVREITDREIRQLNELIRNAR